MSTASKSELWKGCLALRMLLPSNFDDATEVINGDKGTIQWLTVESTTDASGTRTMKSEQTGDFVKEDGVWKFAG